MAELIRAFVAIPIVEPVKNKIATLVNELQKIDTNKSIRWVDIKNIHITLKFLGEIDREKLTILANSLDKICENTQKFDLIFSATGFFPSLRNPKIFWVGCQINEHFSNLFKRIEDICTLNKFSPEVKPISPHITIGRFKNQLSAFDTIKLGDNLNKYKNIDFGTQIINKFILFKSELTPKGPIYKSLRDYNLKV